VGCWEPILTQNLTGLCDGNCFYGAIPFQYLVVINTVVMLARTLFELVYGKKWYLMFCLFCFESHEQFFSNLATVTITGDGCKFRPMLSTYGS
jgi:hypothetical protein